MFYSVLRIFVHLALKIFCSNICVSDKSVLKSRGPLLLACNHPNSFFDAIIIGSLFKQPVHYLARGDAFKKPIVKKLLIALKLIPIYRLSEGREYLALNDATFEQCKQILLNRGIVLIFSEGLCQQQWALQSLKKGTARIAFNAWNELCIANEFRVLPVSVNYNTFKNFNKKVLIHFGECILKKDVLKDANEGEKIMAFNKLLYQRIATGMLLSNSDDELVQLVISNSNYRKFSILNANNQLQSLRESKMIFSWHLLISPYYLIKKNGVLITTIILLLLLTIPALLGMLIHAPLYLTIRNFVRKKTNGTVFYNSVLFGLLLIVYPVYFIMINVIICLSAHHLILQIVFLLMLIWAWIFLVWFNRLQAFYNFLQLSTKNREMSNKIFL